MFFVVYIGFSGVAKQIYYSELTPIKIRVILAKAAEKKTKNIKLRKFPTDPNERAMIFLNCLENCQKQSSFSNAKLFSLEDLEKQGVLEGITIPVSTVGNIDPKTALLTNEVYIYANIKGSAIPQPIEAIPIRLINRLQTVKRMRALTIDEVKELFRIVESSNSRDDILVGAYLLLGQQPAAEVHFEKLSEPQQEEFRKCPIFHFWKEHS